MSAASEHVAQQPGSKENSLQASDRITLLIILL
jgi:hypothetical protein